MISLDGQIFFGQPSCFTEPHMLREKKIVLKNCHCFNVDIYDSVTVDHSLQSALLLCKQ